MTTTMPQDDFVAALPATQHKSLPWRRTRINPCTCIMQCVKCKEYLPIDKFYVLSKGKARRDILNNRRNSRCAKCCVEDFIELDHSTKLFYAARIHAVQKGIECTIRPEDIVIPTHCPVLGIPLVPKVGQGRKNRHEIGDSPTVDRVDNSKGYIPGNICVISGRANHLKSNATIEEVEAILRYMKMHRASTETDATCVPGGMS